MNETEGLRFRRVHRPQVITDELPENRYKGSGTYSGKVFQVTLLTLGGFVLLPLLVIVLILESPIHPEAFSLKEPPAMKGCWEPNLKLREAERLFEDQILGPESIVNIGGEATRLVSGGQVVAGRKLSFINDVAVTQDGKKLYFTDSSSRWQRRDYMHLIMEATADGRVLEYDTESRELTVVMDNLRFPNGIHLLPDEESVLVAETTMARIRRVHVAGLNKGGMDTFMDNLPGFPDNIRPSSSGGYWVAMSAVRPNPGFSMLDFLSQRPWIKKLIFKLFSQEVMMKFVPRYSLVAELHDGGICTRSFHDPNGLVAAYISEVHEYAGSLYLGSFRSPYIAKLDLSKV
ncbi:adipocyte plasma membrane-associated protein-like isoform X3 [Micropterus salmoides]|uniref:adipocyte plasma membrane-associated protein-like isoform X3 n=1 Tax=Micropterus salmoides TaxID=27706 RepID=UPI0018EA963B|nr:adipocyte plasma membrane-associated protein-like isoform X3 [Micropterus salmoides]XP_038586162.1 adipocyte plasma membrane-associated protein-like isoform X3 [Micropterus salmoides]